MLGWGTTDDLKTWFGTYYLQKVNSPIRSDRECPIWETDPYPKHKDKLICVGGYVDDDYAPSMMTSFLKNILKFFFVV